MLFNILKRLIGLWAFNPAVKDVIEESHSPEGLFYRSVIAGRDGIVPVSALGTARRRYRLFSKQFWCDSWSNFIQRWPELLSPFFMGGLMLCVFIGGILGGIFSGLVVTDSVAISAHPGCSLIESNGTKGNISYVTAWLKYYHDIEAESGEYAKKCYYGQDVSDGCNFFYQQSINFTEKHNEPCPFKSELGDLCYGGPSSALSLTTGKVLPESIGINTPLKYTFQRDTTCSPLLMDDRFIQPFIYVNGNLKTQNYRYFHGNTTGPNSCPSYSANCTFELPLRGLDPSYSVE